MAGFDWSAGVASLALCLSVYNIWSGRRLAQKNEELADVKRELGKVQLKLEKLRVMELNRADFGARFVKGGKSFHLVITNKGKAEARDVKVDFLDGPHFVLLQDVECKFPMDAMDSGSSVRLLASRSMSIREVKEAFEVSWLDDTGRQSKRFSIPAH